MNEFNLSNWTDYLDAIQKYDVDADSDANAMYRKGGSLLFQYQQLKALFDILKDNEINDELLNFVSEANSQLKAGITPQVSLDNILQTLYWGFFHNSGEVKTIERNN